MAGTPFLSPKGSSDRWRPLPREGRKEAQPGGSRAVAAELRGWDTGGLSRSHQSSPPLGKFAQKYPKVFQEEGQAAPARRLRLPVRDSSWGSCLLENRAVAGAGGVSDPT